MSVSQDERLVARSLTTSEVCCLSVLGLIVGVSQLLNPVSLETWEETALHDHLVYALGSQSLGWVCFFIAFYFTWRSKRRSTSPDQSKPNSRRHTIFILVALLVWTRVSWWGGPPSPSEDVWRYLWDGERVSRGLSVYTIAPSELKGLNTESERLRERIGHAEIPTIYPPGAQLCFAMSYKIGALLGGSVEQRLIAWRLLLLLTELALLASLLALIRVSGGHPSQLFPYVLCPLISFESSLAGHLDIIGMTCVVASIALWQSGQRGFILGLTLGFAVWVKFIPLLIFVIMIITGLCAISVADEIHQRKRIRRSLLLSCLGLIVMSAFVFYPFYDELIHFNGLWPGLVAYKERWYFNGSFFPVVYWCVRSLSLELTSAEVHSLTQMILGLFILGVLLHSSILRSFTQYRRSRGDRRDDSGAKVIIEVSVICVTLLLLSSPVIFSWYLLWIIPLGLLTLCLDGSPILSKQFAYMGLTWGVSISLTYFPRLELLSGKEWSFPRLLILLEYSTLALTLLLIKRYTLPSRLSASSPIQTLDIE